MFGDRVFNISVIISTVWHLFWMCAVCIVITPSVQPSNVYQEVDFLGPILEKTAFDILLEEAIPHTETLYASSTSFLDNVYLKPHGPERKVINESHSGMNKDRFTFSLQEYFQGSKDIPLYFVEDIRGVYAESASRVSMPELEGPAGRRDVIFKPERISVSRALYNELDEYTVKLKFYVSRNGIVYDVEPLISSGYPGIDLQAIRFLKQWRFSPLTSEVSDRTDWGAVTVKVEAK